ncbi:MAG: ferrous iron transport protein A [Deltaproteobacteria bacterium]|nr:ferrous iron transport protein A [Deltaproteobacteria bacterium]
MLRYLAEIGIIPDASLRVEKRAPFDGPVHIKLVADAARTSHVLGRRVSECVFVELA